MNENENNTSASAIWVVYFIGFDDRDPQSPQIDPSVGFERIESSETPEQRQEDASMAALLRGGQLLAIVEEDDKDKAAAVAAAFEKEILRIR